MCDENLFEFGASDNAHDRDCRRWQQRKPACHKAQIVTLNLDSQNVTILHLRRGFVSSVRLPEEVSSVVLGDPGAFKAEHSEAEPKLVFFKPTNPKPAETNASDYHQDRA